VGDHYHPLNSICPLKQGQALQGESTCLNHHHQPQLLHPSELVPFQPPKRQLLVRRLKRLPRTWIAYAFLAKWQIRKTFWSSLSSLVFWLAQNCQKNAKSQKKIKKR
jgi:hypothetical protein